MGIAVLVNPRPATRTQGAHPKTAAARVPEKFLRLPRNAAHLNNGHLREGANLSPFRRCRRSLAWLSARKQYGSSGGFGSRVLVISHDCSPKLRTEGVAQDMERYCGLARSAIAPDAFWVNMRRLVLQTTNLGVRSSNLFGRAIKSNT